MDSLRRRVYVARVLVCTPLILLLLGVIVAGAAQWLQITVVIVTVIAIWFPYERVFDARADAEGRV